MFICHEQRAKVTKEAVVVAVATVVATVAVEAVTGTMTVAMAPETAGIAATAAVAALIAAAAAEGQGCWRTEAEDMTERGSMTEETELRAFHILALAYCVCIWAVIFFVSPRFFSPVDFELEKYVAFHARSGTTVRKTARAMALKNSRTQCGGLLPLTAVPAA